MPRRTTRHQLAAFLRNLSRTGNFALAADLAGLAKSGLYKRRARDPDFAAAVEAALKSSPERAQPALRLRRRECAGGMPAEGGGPAKLVEGAPRLRSGRTELGCAHPVPSSPEGLRTRAGDLAFSRYAGRPQRRRMPAGRLTRFGIANFFAALANTGNIRLAAAQVGVAASSIHARRRADPDFARQLEAALEIAKTNIAAALIQAADRTFGADWIEDVDPDGPRMTIGQAIWFVSRRPRS